MGKREHPLVWYYSQSLHFAELINGWLFHGNNYLSPESLSDADRKTLRRQGAGKYKDCYRDLCKQTDGMALRLFIGVEEQNHIHYAMPVRIMDYDSASYITQKIEISNRHLQNSDLKEDEFLSGFSKKDRLLPVITLVLYCGLRPWDGALRLHELLDFRKVPPSLRNYVADYRIHVLDICHTSDRRLREFPPDIRTMFLFFKYQNEPEKLMKELADAEDIRPDTYDAIADFSGERRLKQLNFQKKGAKINMCKAIDMLIADGEKRGEKRGFQLGSEQEKKNTLREKEKASRERANVLREKARADKAEARVRELERMLNL